MAVRSDAASEAAIAWSRAHGSGQAQAQESFSALHAELIGLVPDAAEASVANIREVPTILAICDDLLLTATAGEREDGADRVIWQFEFVARWLGGRRASVSLADEVRAVGNKTTRLRTWGFHLDNDDLLELNGSEVVRGGFSGESQPDAGEVSARMIARGLGWQLPQPDASPAQY